MTQPRVCLDDSQIFELVNGDITVEDLLTVDDHIDSCSTCREIVLSVARARATPRKVGRYLVLDELGRGAFGVVYRAYDPELDRRVALKLVFAQITSEARAMAKLTHPNVVAIHDVGAYEDRTYIAMELVGGQTLRHWLMEAREPLAVRDVFAQAGEGLCAAHDAGLVHRDFKPANVLIGDDGRVRVTDFGLARDAMDPSDTAIAGTPAYMAPEVREGAAADALSDQYSFCVALYEGLCGERPRDAVRQSDSIPRWLYDPVKRGLSRDPAARFPSMRALLVALAADPREKRRRALVATLSVIIAAGLMFGLANQGQAPPVCNIEPIVLRATQRSQLAERFAGEAPTLADAALVSIEQGITKWSAEEHEARLESCLATRVRGEQSAPMLDRRASCFERQRLEVVAVMDALARADRVAIANTQEIMAALPDASRCSSGALSDVTPPSDQQRDALRDFDRLLVETRAQLALGQLQSARKLGSDAVAVAKKAGYDPARSQASLAHASALFASRELDAAEDAAFNALWAARRAHVARTVSAAWLLLASIAGDRGRYVVAERRCHHADAAISNPPKLLEANLRNTRGILLTGRGRYEEAQRELAYAHALRTDELGDKHVVVARSHTSLGNLYRAMGDYQLALEHHRLARAIDTELLGDAHPNQARHLHNIARVTLLNGDIDGAQDRYERALTMKRAFYGEGAEVGVTLNSLGLLHLVTGDLDAADESFRRATALLGDNRVAAAFASYNIGLLAARRGEGDAARSAYARASKLLHDTFGDDHPLHAKIASARSTLTAPTEEVAPKPPVTPRAVAPPPPVAPGPKLQPQPQPPDGAYVSEKAWN
jgi:tetratricopeptide (TPR) repeat protein